MTTDMLFRVGSMTKMITAMATLTLVQERGISLSRGTTMTHGSRAGPLAARANGDYVFAWTDTATGASGTCTFRVVPDQAGGAKYLSDRLLAYRRLP